MMQPDAESAPGGEVLDAPQAVRIENLSKTFPGQRALNSLSLEVRRGEIHALVGQNGSGKSTLIKILSGFHKPDPGARAWLGDQEVTLGALSDEQLGRMKFIHQDLALVPLLSVRENLGIDRMGRGPLAPFDRKQERLDARELLATFNLDIDPDVPVGDLSPFECSAVAIARALGTVGRDVELLVLDEPTASMGAAEAQQLFATLHRVNDIGVAILYVSHILPEVLEIAARITVIRDGRRVAVVQASETTEEDLVELIVGRSIEKVAPPQAGERSQALLGVDRLTAPGVADVSFSAHAGEILGLTGLTGSGYQQIAECLAGANPIHTGTVEIDGQRVDHVTPSSAVAAGLVSMPADRRKLGLIAAFTLAENITLPDIGKSWRRGLINRRAEAADVRHWLDTTGVVPPEPRRLVQELSGGNQQKVMLAKALRLNPRVLLLGEPTQAVDVGASASIRQLIIELAADDRAIVVASSDFEELQQICHRVLVTRNGRIACELVGDEITEDRLLFESQFEGATT